MYRISVEADFSSAHSLREYEGKCSSLHGHNWRVRLTVRTDQLDSRGIGVDFGKLKKMLAALVARFDHVDLNQVAPFDKLNPTAENISRTIFELAEKELPPGVGVEIVELWESEKNRVGYSKG
jgi:6-pyruvoyltetrahydropterin/6-carboxytetrahydropterin synthase